MANIRPFRALRPTKERAHEVAALPYDVMNSVEAREMVKDNPYSFLHVDKAEIDLDPGIDLYDEAVYQKAKENLEQLWNDGILQRDQTPCYYIYQLTMDGRKQTGLVAGASVEDYQNDIIKKHEFTRADKERDRIRHVDTTNAQTGPIFLTYREHRPVTNLIENWKSAHAPIYSFTAEDGIGHAAWIIDDEGAQQVLTQYFAEIPNLYIADGHHRSASAVRVAEQRQEKGQDITHFLSVSFPSNQLYIMDYNRVVKDLQGKTPQELMDEIKKAGFTLEPVTTAHQPKKRGDFGMYLDGQWYALTGVGIDFSEKNVAEKLDVSILQEHLLTPLLAIGDPRVDERIDFIGGIRGLEELEKRVDSGTWAVAFSMFPTSMDEVMDIADHGMVMPPKSTWFEPKLRSGLFINPLDD